MLNSTSDLAVSNVLHICESLHESSISSGSTSKTNYLNKQLRYEGILIRMEDEGFVPTREWKRYWERIVDRETVAQVR